jgi:hypothetical protein
MARVSDREQIIVLVRLQLPPGMTPDQGADELRRSVQFGQPDVTLMRSYEQDR